MTCRVSALCRSWHQLQLVTSSLWKFLSIFFIPNLNVKWIRYYPNDTLYLIDFVLWFIFVVIEKQGMWKFNPSTSHAGTRAESSQISTSSQRLFRSTFLFLIVTVKCGIGTVDWYCVNWSCRPIYRLLLSRFKRLLLTFWFISPDVLVDSPDVLVNFPVMLISWSTYWLTSPWCWSVRPFRSNVRKQCLLKEVLNRISYEQAFYGRGIDIYGWTSTFKTKTCWKLPCHL